MSKHKIGIVFLFSLIAISCLNFEGEEKKIHTPDGYLNVTKVDPNVYVKDRNILERQMKALMDSHKQSFHSKEYFDSTEVEIDTILYDKTFQKVIVFILTKNPTTRQVIPNRNYTWYYDAYCYLGVKRREEFKLKWMQPFSLVNFYNRKEASEYIKEQYFTEFTTIKDAKGLVINKYNLDDNRFWEDPIWKDFFGE